MHHIHKHQKETDPQCAGKGHKKKNHAFRSQLRHKYTVRCFVANVSFFTCPFNASLNVIYVKAFVFTIFIIIIINTGTVPLIAKCFVLHFNHILTFFYV